MGEFELAPGLGERLCQAVEARGGEVVEHPDGWQVRWPDPVENEAMAPSTEVPVQSLPETEEEPPLFRATALGEVILITRKPPPPIKWVGDGVALMLARMRIRGN